MSDGQRIRDLQGAEAYFREELSKTRSLLAAARERGDRLAVDVAELRAASGAVVVSCLHVEGWCKGCDGLRSILSQPAETRGAELLAAGDRFARAVQMARYGSPEQARHMAQAARFLKEANRALDGEGRE